MKRSQINGIIRQAEAFFAEYHVHLPPFGMFSPAQIRALGEDWRELRDNMLGWDITDFGSGDYARVGLLMFTLRNGNYKDPSGKPYAEKLLLADENQHTPMHFHHKKMEDIIVRAGGNLIVKVYNATQTDALAETDVAIMMDGRRYAVPAGTEVRLTPGESITLPQRQYHEFWGEPGHGRVLIGEVSRVNDDKSDNRFLNPVGRFAAIEEDEAPLRLLCNEY